MFARTPCPDSPSLRRLLLGSLPLPDGEPLYQHLDECDRCAELARGFGAEDWLSEAVRSAGAGGAENASVLCLIDTLNRSGPPAPDDHPNAPPAAGLSATTPPHGEAPDTNRELFDFLGPAREPGELGRLGEYRILKVLGAGGMGVVFHAEDPALQRPVAVKAMRPGLAASASARRRFLREGRAAAALHNDHVVPIFQVGEDRGVPYLAMPLLRGETLEDRLRREAALPAAEVFRIGREIALGLAAAHAKGLIHRDIKPANIWLESDEPNAEGITLQGTASPIAAPTHSYGRVKILDFGLARPATGATLTQEGAVVGTPAFMAPEQAKGAAVDARSDLFSLGCVLYRMAAGAAPFPGDDAVAVLLAVTRDHPRPPAEVNPAVPPPLSALVMRLLAKDPADRPASAREVIERLTQAEAEAAAPPPRKTKRGLGSLALLALALVLGVGAVAAMGVRVTVPTDHGDVTIQTDDPNIEVVATKGGKLVRIVDPQSKQTWELDPQKYELRMADQPDGLSIALDGKAPFVLKRKGEKLVTITRGQEAVVSEQPPTDHIRKVRCFEGPEGRSVEKLAVTRNGQVVIATRIPGNGWPLDVGNNLRIYDLTTGKKVATVEGSVRAVSIATSSDGQTAISGGWQEVRIWDFAGRKVVSEWKTGDQTPSWQGCVLAVALSPDGKFAYSASFNGDVVKWELATGKSVTFFQKASIPSMALSANGERLAFITGPLSPSSDCRVRVYDAKTATELCAIPTSTGEFPGVCLTPDGRRVAWGHADGTIRVWDIDADREAMRLPFVKGNVLALAFSPDGGVLLATTGDGAMRLFDARTGKCLDDYTAASGVHSVAFTPDGRHVVTGNHDGNAYMYRLPDPVPAEKVGLAEAAAAGRFPESIGVSTPIPVPPWVTERIEEKYCHDKDFKTPILPPIRDGFPPPTCKDPPDDSAILRAMPPLMSVPNVYEEYRDNVEIVKERLMDKIDPPRFFPLVGPAQLHRCHWKCTVYYDDTVESNYPFPATSMKPRVQVVYIDKDHLHLCPGSAKESPPADGGDLGKP